MALRRRRTMMHAVVLLKIRNELINEVAEHLVELDGVSEVYSVAGQYDLVAILRAPDDEGIAAVVTEHMLKIEGMISSETLIAFRAYSKHDLGKIFSIGLE
jgi:DNA-binding Lrp family transcriptional regulator